MLYSENHFKPEHGWEARLYELYFDIIVISIGIIGFFQLVSTLTFLVYSYIFFLYVCMLTLHIVSISIGS